MAAVGGIIPLIQRLDLPSLESQANAAGALWSLAQDPENQVQIVHHGGAAKLITQLSSGSSAAKLSALGALRWVLIMKARSSCDGAAAHMHLNMDCIYYQYLTVKM